ncbi:MAG: uL22 family ribosomal protein, partial [Bacteroidota bacterium]
MEAVAKLNSIPMSARKMRLVADLVRGKGVGEALSILKYSKQEASYWIEKNLVS